MSDASIVRVRAWAQEQPFRDGPYGTSAGVAAGFESVVVRLDSAAGAVGVGEAAPLGAFYDPAFPAGMRAGVGLLAPGVLGHDGRRPRALARRLDGALRGHPYAKAALDMAAWDLAARLAGTPLADLLGGRSGDAVALYRAVPPLAPADAAARAAVYVEQGYGTIQVKVGGDPAPDAERVAAVRDAVGPGVALFADANGGWTAAQARRFIAAAAGEDLWLEQPCATLAECAGLRGTCPWPLVLDESIDGLRPLLAAAGVADAVTIKLARVGGVGAAALLRDVAVELGLHVTVEDTGGSDVDTAAMAHLSLSTPAERRLHTVDFNAWVSVANARGLPAPAGGRLGLPVGPGLGVELLEDALGEPFVDLRS